MELSVENIIAILSTLGLGGLIGSYVTYVLNKREYKSQMLHEKRIEVIVELYQKIVDTDAAMGEATIEFEGKEFKELGSCEKRLSEAENLLNLMMNFYFRNKIYLEDSLANDVENFGMETLKVCFYLEKIKNFKEPDFKMAQEKMHSLIRPMKKKLERKLQAILGV